MSQKRPLKRGINTLDDNYSPSFKSLQPKRSRIEGNSEQIKTQSDDSSSVRRSSRAPKPKVFDDEYTDTSVRSPGSEREIPKKKEPKSISRNQGERRSIDDVLAIVEDEDTSSSTKRRSSRVPKPKLFDEEYLETTKFRGTEDKNEKNMSVASEVRIPQDGQKDSSFEKGSTKSKKTSSKHGKGNVTTTPGLQPELAIKGSEGAGAWETPKVRTSSRTPVPKKTFALIDDSPISRPGEGLFDEGDMFVDIMPQEPHAAKQSKKLSLGQSDSSPASAGEVIDIIGTSPISSKKKWTLKDTGSNEGKHKKSTKSKTGLDSSTVLKDVIGTKAPKKNEIKKKESEGKEKVKKVSSKAAAKTSDIKANTKKSTAKNKNSDISEDVVDIVGIQQVEVKKKSKTKKAEVKQSGLAPLSSDGTKNMPGFGSVGVEHGKKSSKHSKPKHKDQPHSEVKDEDHHIILKVHLPHGEASHHSHSHSHSHKKHKHKHSSESKSESGSESKTKKPKLSLESEASEDKHKKKLSIKFKGLSSSTPGVEFQAAEKTAEVEKKNKDMESAGKKKKSKKPSVDQLPIGSSGSDEKEHVKVVIKKNKKDMKVIADEGEKPTKKVTKAKDIQDNKPKEDKDHDKAKTPIKTTPKKKTKAGESPKSAEKEKRKIVSGYLLFCKKERSRIYEANPGLEFAQISQKVGEAWKSLPESTKQEWKAKADNMKKNLTPTKEDKKAEATKPGPDAVDMAAHLKLLGESLSVIGVSLMAQKETEVHGSLSVLLDSILCALCPLTFLTSHIPGIPGISKEMQLQILDDLAYTMPGLG